MAKMLQVVVVTPEQTALEQEAEFVALPLFDGEIGIAVDHSPLIGRLGFGEMRIKTGGKELHYYIDGGFVQVVDNVVSVLTNRAVPAAKLDVTVAQAALVTAQAKPATTDELLALRDRAILQARAQIRVAKHAKA
ncbi:ATP synthase epsilon chain, sodium ion specific [Anatilimnocola aggregata]|uniref:ATP synthase epsilon chain n=1 Tax=Anatilimnocola aggregata TaxID=2528021 RepID=A0A517YER8_9BACT|nr:ATP synthase F1 subunit epsilon [Anatilimnocola aggregata]QDU28717.1 ATP synthase epsilon chain, sodium ion specific [Anatilimnocola aggregata]